MPIKAGGPSQTQPQLGLAALSAKIAELKQSLPPGKLYVNAGVSVDVLSGPSRGESIVYSAEFHEDVLEVVVAAPALLDALAALIAEREAPGKTLQYNAARKRADAALARLMEEK